MSNDVPDANVLNTPLSKNRWLGAATLMVAGALQTLTFAMFFAGAGAVSGFGIQRLSSAC